MRKLLGMTMVFLLSLCQLSAQTKEVTGKVTDAKDGTPLSGVTVKVRGAAKTSLTESDGTFRISVTGAKPVLIFSYVGYNDLEVPVVGESVNVQLVLGERTLSEVVVVGYGQSQKKELTSSIVKVKGSDVANTPVPNFNQALQGRAAGVFVEANNGKVGEGIKVRIRGQSSINASNAPLYVIDGIPMVTGSLSGNALADLNFNDVESFDVLKDAAATAIYGSRAANGVILITTKKGKAGKPRYQVGVQMGTNSPTGKRGFLNADEYIKYFTTAAENTAKYHYNRAGNWRGYASEQAAINDMVNWMKGRFTRYSGFSDWTKLETNTNWEDEAFQDAKVFSADASASGGNDRTKYYFSGSYNNQDGILFGNNFRRISGRLNLEQELTSKLKVGINMSLANTKARRVPEDNDFSTPMQIVALAPITPIRDKNGALYDRPTTTYYNPLIELENAEYYSYSFRNLNSAFAQYNFMNDLYFRSEFGVDVLNQNDEEFYGSKTINGQATNGFGRSTWLRNTRYTSNNYMFYKFNLGEKNEFDATAGFAFEKNQARTTSTSGEQFPGDDLRGLSNAAKILTGSSTLGESALASWFGRINYRFNDRYLLGLSGRYDGSSVFGLNNRWGFFPAVSVGWILSEEKFLNNVAWLNLLKIRGSYGQLGNSSGFGNYTAQPAYVAGKYSGQAILAPGRLGNLDLTWETSNQTDIGLEFALFKNRLSGEIDWYDKRSAKNNRGFIFNLPVPLTTGYPSIIKNLGEIVNSGVEFTLNSVNVDKRDFKWTTSFNISYNKNKVIRIDGDQDTLSFNDGRYMNALIVGQPIGVHYGPRYAGVDPSNGDALYFEQDGKTTTNDYNAAGSFVVGDPNPKWFGGIGNTFTYKGFELSVLFQGVFDYEIVNGAGGFMSARGDWFDNQTRDQLNSWTPTNKNTNIPEARINRFGDFQSPGVSTQYMEDGSYVRLKNLTVAYTFNTRTLGKLKLSNARLYLTGVNLATFTKYTGWDPEVNTDYRASNINQGGDFYAAPQIKSFAAGLTVNF
jgi:TonB-dependent starch-binding outer membrane protein SusC